MIDTKKCDLRVVKTTISGGARTNETIFEGWVSPTAMRYLASRLELDISGWQALKPVRFCVEIVDSVENGRTRLGTLEFSKLGTDPVSHLANFNLDWVQTCVFLADILANIRSPGRSALRTEQAESFVPLVAQLLIHELDRMRDATSMLQ